MGVPPIGDSLEPQGVGEDDGGETTIISVSTGNLLFPDNGVLRV